MVHPVEDCVKSNADVLVVMDGGYEEGAKQRLIAELRIVRASMVSTVLEIRAACATVHDASGPPSGAGSTQVEQQLLCAEGLSQKHRY